MCSAITKYLQAHATVRVRIISSNPTTHRELANENVAIVNRRLMTVLRSLMDSDVFCQAGGTIFHDSYKGTRLLAYWCKLLCWAAIFWAARFFGTHVVIVGAGVGPLSYSISRLIARVAFRACTAIGVRDQASKDTLAELSPSIRCERGFDLALLDEEILSSAPRCIDGHPKKLALSVCSLTEFLGSSALNDKYWSALSQALTTFHAECPIRVSFISLFTGRSSEGDETIARLVAAGLPADLPVEYHKYTGSLGDLSKTLAAADWLICTKFHAAVAAYALRSNFAIVSYNRKVRDFADEVNLPFHRRVDANVPQPVSVWLDVLRSLVSQEQSHEILDLHESRLRAQHALRKVLKTTGVLLHAEV